MLNSRIQRFFSLFSFLLLSAAVAGAQQAAAPGPMLTLDQAITNAVANSKQLKISAVETGKIEDRIAATLTTKKPTSNLSFYGAQTLNQINFTFQPGQFGNFPATGPIPPTRTEVGTPRTFVGLAIASVDQPLTQLSKINLAVGAQKLEIEANQEKIRQQRQELVYQVRQIYYQILLKESALESSNEASEHYAEMDRFMTVSLAQQTVLRSDALEVKSLIAQEQYNKITLRNSIDEQKETLNQLMGQDIRTPFRTERVAEASPLELDLAAAQAQALSQRPELKQAEIRIKQADTDLRLKKSVGKPEVSLFFRYISPINTETLPQNVSLVGFHLSWEPWDWGRKNKELDEKVKTVEQTKESLIDAKNQVLTDVSQRFRKLEEARALFTVIQTAQEAAREKVRLSQQQYAAQTVLLKDLLQVQVSLAEVNQRYQQALLAFWSAKADFEKAIGRDQ